MEEKTISFAREVKEEILKSPWSETCLRSILSSFIKTNGHLKISGGEESLELTSESAQIAKAVYSYVHELYGIDASFAYTKSMGLHKRVLYHVIIKDPDYILGDLEVDFLEGKIPHNMTATPDLAAAYIAGGFLSSGSVNDPHSSNYHLEIALNDENYAKWWSHLINRVQGHQFSSKVCKRRSQYVVYMKQSERISDFLVYIGAPNSCLKFENVRVDRDFSNIGNRLQNLDMANMEKTLSAGKRQKAEIEFFVKRVGLENIDNPKLKALMELRLQYEDATLEELAHKLSEQLATTISKSNVNHLFRYIHQEYLKAHGQ